MHFFNTFTGHGSIAHQTYKHIEIVAYQLRQNIDRKNRKIIRKGERLKKIQTDNDKREGTLKDFLCYKLQAAMAHRQSKLIDFSSFCSKKYSV